MEEIDELVPLSADDLKFLYAKRYVSRSGSAKWLFLLAAFSAYSVFAFYGGMLFVQTVVGILSIGFVVLGIRIIRSPRENKEITLDIKEGYKRRIVAPIESKEAIDVSPTVKGVDGVYRKGVALEFAYTMTVKQMIFSIKEKFYLAGPRKGEFVEIFFAPHSNTVLSDPTKFQK